MFLDGLAKNNAVDMPHNFVIANEHLKNYDSKRILIALRSTQNIIRTIKKNCTPGYAGGTLAELYFIAKNAVFKDSDMTSLTYTHTENIRFADVVKKDLVNNGFLFSDFVYSYDEKPKKNPNLNKVMQFTFSYNANDFDDLLFGLKFFADVCALYSKDNMDRVHFLEGDVSITSATANISQKENEYKIKNEKTPIDLEWQQKNKPKIEEVAPHLLDNEMLHSVLDFSKYAKENKTELKWAGIHNTWKALYKGKVIFYIRLKSPNNNLKLDTHYSDLSNKSWAIEAYIYNIEEYSKIIFAENLQDVVWANLYHCTNCFPDRICAKSKGVTKNILGKNIDNLCRGHRIFWFWDPDKTTIKCVKRLIELEKQVRADKL